MDDTFIDRLNSLPQRADETWQGGLVRMPQWITGEDREPYRPYAPLWVAVRSDMVHVGTVTAPEEQDLELAVEALIEFALEDKFGGYRPGRIEVADQALAERLVGLAAPCGIEVKLVERLEAVARAVESLQTFDREGELPVPGALEGAGVSLERMRTFADAAAAFYRAALWQFVTDVDLIRIHPPPPPSGMEYCVVLGAGRSMYGLAFYASVAQYAKFVRAAGEFGGDLLAGKGLWQLAFHPITQIPSGDSDLWLDHGLPVAGQRAYPALMRFGPGRQIARATADELAFVEGLLRALAETTEEEIDSGRWQKDLATHDDPARVALSIPDLLKPPSRQEWMQRGFTPDSRANERFFADVHRYFEARPPKSKEEMEAVLNSQFLGRSFDDLVTFPQTLLDRAQEVCFQAFETYGRRRVQLARQALSIYPDCADAYVILAEQAGTAEAERDYFAQAMAAGERALGPEAFHEHMGHFWGVSGTRPYMRARFGLAQALEELGQIEEAVAHYQEMLRLNPNDNQGVRYLLMPKLLQLGHDAEAAGLLKQYQEQSANSAYARALLAFRLSGPSLAAQAELRTATRVNPYVPQVLMETRPLPSPDHYSHGSLEEALICVAELRPALEATEGAMEWLTAEQRRREKALEARRREQRRKDRQKRKKRRGR